MDFISLWLQAAHNLSPSIPHEIIMICTEKADCPNSISQIINSSGYSCYATLVDHCAIAKRTYVHKN